MYSQHSISARATSMDSTNHRSKIFGRKKFQEALKVKPEFASLWQLFT